MKIYKTDSKHKLAWILGFIFLIGIGAIGYITGYVIYGVIFHILIFIFVMLVFLATWNEKIIIHEDRIEYIRGVLPSKMVKITLFWDEIKELRSNYFFYPESGNISLIPLKHLSKKSIDIPMITAFSLDALRDILTHMPSSAKVYLYEYLKRKLEGSQTWVYKDSNEPTTAGAVIERIRAAEEQRDKGKIKEFTITNIFRAIIKSDSFKQVFGAVATLVIGVGVGILVILIIYFAYSKLF
jgi:hypothetical protein